jgi:hypothetical protein
MHMLYSPRRQSGMRLKVRAAGVCFLDHLVPLAHSPPPCSGGSYLVCFLSSVLVGHPSISTAQLCLNLFSSVLAQTSTSFTDPDNGITFQGLQEPVHDVSYGFVFPESTTGDEFIGEILAPIDAQWIGIALGGAMAGDLLLVAWPNGNSIVSSTRFAT